MSTNQTSRLDRVRTGRIHTGKRFTFYGVEAVGKTSLGAAAPGPILIDIEDGSSHLDVPRYLFRDGDPRGHVPITLQEVYAAVADLTRSPHDYQTLVIDTVDSLEPMIWRYVCERDSGKQSNLNKSGKKLISIESYGYGRGYVVALDQWRDLAARLDRLRVERGMNIVLLSHSQIRTFKNPEGEDFDRYQLRIKDSAAAFLREWCDLVGYCCFENVAAKLNDDDSKAKGFSTGRRLIMLERTAAYDAKTRVPMPREIEMSQDDPWGPFGRALQEGSEATPDHLAKLIKKELKRLADDELTDKVNTAIDGANGNTAVLSRYLNELRTREPKEGATNV